MHYVTRPVAYADISATVSETGIVNPVTQVTVGSEVSGTVRALNVDFNSKVLKGQVLANLDPTTYQAAVDSAQANLTLSQASTDSAQVNVDKMKYSSIWRT
jgi:HlyD family secretion protein